MMFEPLYLSLFLLASVSGVARFRGKARWDHISLMTSYAANVAGSFFLGVAAATAGNSLLMVPLSLLILMHASTFIFRNYFLQIACLPIVVAEILGSYFFVDVESLLPSAGVFLGASLVHLGLLSALLKVIKNLESEGSSKPTLWSPYPLAMNLSVAEKSEFSKPCFERGPD